MYLSRLNQPGFKVGCIEIPMERRECRSTSPLFPFFHKLTCPPGVGLGLARLGCEDWMIHLDTPIPRSFLPSITLILVCINFGL